MKQLIALLILACTLSASAQTPSKHEQIITNCCAPSSSNPHTLIFINGQETAMGAFILEPDNIKSIDVLKGQKATAKYGDRAKEGAIVIKLKEQTNFSRLSEIFAHFKVPAEQQQLKIAIDGTMVRKPELLLVGIASVKDVALAAADNPFIEGGKEKYLNLITK